MARINSAAERSGDDHQRKGENELRRPEHGPLHDLPPRERAMAKFDNSPGRLRCLHLTAPSAATRRAQALDFRAGIEIAAAGV
jgi:hypothetical protein